MSKIRGNIHLGDIFDAQNEGFRSAHGIQNVVTVTAGELPVTTHYHPLTDGENEYETFATAVDAAQEAVETGEPTLIHCTVGQSRSPTVIACLLALEDDCSFDEALDELRDHRHVHPEPELRALAERYIEETRRNTD